jgi:hypothetical protein
LKGLRHLRFESRTGRCEMRVGVITEAAF